MQCKWYSVFTAILVHSTDGMCLAHGILSQKLGCVIRFDVIHPYLHRTQEIVAHRGDQDGLVDYQHYHCPTTWVII